MGQYAVHESDLDATGCRVAVVAGRFNREIVQLLYDGAVKEFERLGVASDAIDAVWVPGAFELPLMAKTFAATGSYDAIVCVGAVVRGGTPHFDYVAGECARGLMNASLETGVPIVFGVLTTDNKEQAFDRAGGAEGNKGAEAAATAIEMVTLLRAVNGEH
ncbi:MAG: 6,7-dimethyl-8-ribityllumazine synthase [Acidimicrobiia bacterium]